MKKILIFLFFLIYGFGENIKYGQSDIHTLTLPKNQVDISLYLLKINDKIDIFNIKEKELGNIKNYDSIGDLKGYELKFRYGISNNLMLSINLAFQDIEYSSDKISNKREDIFFRYNIFQNRYAFFNSGISIDFGYVKNSMKDFYLKDIETINNLIKKVLPDKIAELRYSDGTTIFDNEPFPREKGYYAVFENTTTKLNNEPYIALLDTYDESYYLRFITGFYTLFSLNDFYIGIKRTKIKNLLTTTEEILKLAEDQGYDLNKKLDRYESMLFFGFNNSLNYKKYIFEFNYEFEKFIRDKDLGYINYNHVINASISYILTKNILISIGGKFMYRQLNGQIPYLYNKYTQTSFDHRYGYVKAGIIYSF